MKKLLYVLPILAGMVGCTGVRAPIEGRADPYRASQIHFDSETLRKDTAVEAPIFGRNESGLLVTTIPIRSAINKTLYVDYRVTYFDSQRRVLSSAGPFNKTLLPNVPDQIQLTAPNPEVSDIQVDFYYAR